MLMWSFLRKFTLSLLIELQYKISNNVMYMTIYLLGITIEKYSETDENKDH